MIALCALAVSAVIGLAAGLYLSIGLDEDSVASNSALQPPASGNRIST